MGGTHVLRSRRGRLVVGGAAAAALALAVPAIAHHGIDNMRPTLNYNTSCYGGGMPNSAPICQSDNSGLSYGWESTISSTGRSTIASVMTNQYDPTHFTTRLENPPVYGGGAETDILFQQSTSGLLDSEYGTTWCNDAVDDFKCDQHYVRLRYSSPGTWIACHESGHAVGLTHGTTASPTISDNDPSLACMMRTTPSTVLGTHNKYMIDGTYP
jgi:hypothetical protein